MADWNVALPPVAVEGAETHVEDHNAIVDAIREARTNVDGVEGVAAGKADATHTHDAGDIGAGTFAAARIPTLAVSKITGLSGTLEDKADASALADLVSRVEALEAAADA